MGLSDRVSDWLTYVISVVVTWLGVRTVNETVAIAGLLIGVVTAARSWLHRTRIEQALRQRNALIATIVSNAARRPLTEQELTALRLIQGEIDENRH